MRRNSHARSGSPDSNEAAFPKIAESARVDPYGERSSIVIVESRVCLTDESSRRSRG
jgi:hypothetical protein